MLHERSGVSSVKTPIPRPPSPLDPAAGRLASGRWPVEAAQRLRNSFSLSARLPAPACQASPLIIHLSSLREETVTNFPASIPCTRPTAVAANAAASLTRCALIEALDEQRATPRALTDLTLCCSAESVDVEHSGGGAHSAAY